MNNKTTSVYNEQQNQFEQRAEQKATVYNEHEATKVYKECKTQPQVATAITFCIIIKQEGQNIRNAPLQWPSCIHTMKTIKF